MPPREVNLGIVGASGMYGQGVIKRTFVQVANFGIRPWLGNLGMEKYAANLPETTFNIVAIGTRNENSGLRMQSEYEAETGTSPSFFWGDAPWEDMLDKHPEIDVLVITTPDHLHYQPTVHALEKNMHVIIQKPMTLKPTEADHIIALANKKDCVVTIDTHKHFGPKHIHVKNKLLPQMGTPRSGTIFMGAPLKLAQHFNWRKFSDPAALLGYHWTDLIHWFFGAKPVSLHAIGQKGCLQDTYDSTIVTVTYDNGMAISYHANWIMSDAFESPVKQGMEILFEKGFIISDSQRVGLSYCLEGSGSHTVNPHFTLEVPRPDSSYSLAGYGQISLINCLLAISRKMFCSTTLDELAPMHTTPEASRISVIIYAAARQVMDLNTKYLTIGEGAPVTAKFGTCGIAIKDPIGGDDNAYTQPI